MYNFNRIEVTSMKKRGFTLVELLAVIAVLSVILVIVVPKISNTVYESRKKIFKSNASIYMNKVKYIHQNNNAGELNSSNIVYKIIDGKLNYNGTEIDAVDAKLEGNGFVELDESGRTRVSIKNEDFCAIKDFNSNEIVVTDYDGDTLCGEVYIPLYVELNGGTSNQTFAEEYMVGTKIELEDPIKTNAIFSGWEIVKGNSTLTDNILTIGDTETILYATWKVVAKLDVDLNGGSSSQE